MPPKKRKEALESPEKPVISKFFQRKKGAKSVEEAVRLSPAKKKAPNLDEASPSPKRLRQRGLQSADAEAQMDEEETPSLPSVEDILARAEQLASVTIDEDELAAEMDALLARVREPDPARSALFLEALEKSMQDNEREEAAVQGSNTVKTRSISSSDEVLAFPQEGAKLTPLEQQVSRLKHENPSLLLLFEVIIPHAERCLRRLAGWVSISILW